MAPDDEAFSRAARWSLQIPVQDWAGVKDLFLTVRYSGDVARLNSGGKLLVDDFYNGEPWQVGLDRFRATVEAHGLDLEVLPRRADAPIFLERPFRKPLGAGQVLELGGVTLTPQYELTIDLP